LDRDSQLKGCLVQELYWGSSNWAVVLDCAEDGGLELGGILVDIYTKTSGRRLVLEVKVIGVDVRWIPYPVAEATGSAPRASKPTVTTDGSIEE